MDKEWQNATHWPKHLVVRYNWNTINEVLIPLPPSLPSLFALRSPPSSMHMTDTKAHLAKLLLGPRTRMALSIGGKNSGKPFFCLTASPECISLMHHHVQITHVSPCVHATLAASPLLTTYTLLCLQVDVDQGLFVVFGSSLFVTAIVAWSVIRTYQVRAQAAGATESGGEWGFLLCRASAPLS